MKMRLLLALIFGVAVITGCGGSSGQGSAVATSPATNNDGSTVTGIITPLFNPLSLEIPLPNTLARSGTTDFTLNLSSGTNFGDPLVAISALDGWSTTEKWVASFVEEEVGLSDYRPPANIDATTVIPGATVRFFEVVVDLAGQSGVTGAVVAVNRELTPGVDYVAVASGSNVAIIPLRPLKELTGYMAVLTEGIKDADGNNSTADLFYYAAKRTEPLVDATGSSTDPLLSDAIASAAEPLRKVVNTHLSAAASMGMDPDSITLSWTAVTQSTKVVTKVVRSLTQPAPTTAFPTGLNSAAFGLAGLADLSMGVITLPYFLDPPSADNPTAPLTTFWQAAPGAYVPPFDALGLDPTSTHVTALNPIPVIKDMQTVPLLISTPSAASGFTKPAAGWPVVIFSHGVTGNRTQLLAVADTLASVGYAAIAMDLPMHGISPDESPHLAGLYIENTPLAPLANERTFDVDYVNNATGAPGSDDLIDGSGIHSIPVALGSLLSGRDYLRQGQVDYSTLAVSIPFMDINGDTLPDFDGSNIGFVGHSWGAIHGTVFVAIEPTVTRAVLNTPGGGIARFIEASPVFGPRIRAGLQAAAGLEPGTADYESFFLLWQTAIDPADPVNWISEAAQFNAILLQEVKDESYIPNFLPTAPLSGTEPMIALGGLPGISSSRSDPAGLRVATRFLPPAVHYQILTASAGSPAATVEMQSEMASFIASFGTQVLINDPSVLVPE
jgi:pimeloyl-ACP methyl ester carboxylesterase